MKILSRSEMKSLAGGQRPGGGGGGIGDVGGSGSCISCAAFGGVCGDTGLSSCWYSNNSDPDAFCRSVYSGCSEATGVLVTCYPGCTMN